MAIPKKRDENGIMRYRLVQTLVELSQKSIILNYNLQSPRDQIQDIPDSAKLFSVTDFKDMYYQVPLERADCFLTAFRGPNGKTYHLTRLPQGHLNSGYNLFKCFETVLSEITKELDLKFYLDDVLIYAETEEEMLQKIVKFTAALEKLGFTLNGEKCDFCAPKVKWAGYDIQSNAISIPKSYLNKLDTLAESIPKTGKEAATIFGVLSYVRAFSKDFAALTAPIVAAITDEKRYGVLRWGDQESKSLTDTVEALKESCRLYKVRYGEGNDLYIFTDASDFAISAVLFQKDDQSNFRLVDCSSRRLNSCERRYSIFRKEACAMALAGEKFYKYLIEPTTTCHFNIDSRSLYLLHKNTANNSTFNLFLQSLLTVFRPATLNFIPGKLNCWADAMSRVPRYWSNKSIKDDFINVFIGDDNKLINNEDPVAEFESESNTKQQELMIKSIRMLSRKPNKPTINRLPVDVDREIKQIMTRSKTAKLNENKEPEPTQQDELRISSDNENQSTKDIQCAEEDEIEEYNDHQCDENPNIQIESHREITPRSKVGMESLVEARHPSDTRADLEALTKKIVRKQTSPDKTRQAMMIHQRFHTSARELSQLTGISVSESRKICSNCPSCQKNPAPNAHLIVNSGFQQANEPFKRVFADVFHLDNKSNIKDILLMVDQFSNMIWLAPIRNMKAGTILNAILTTFTGTAPLMKYLLTDNASYFRDEILLEKLAEFGVIMQKSSAYRSNANYAERNIRTTRNFIKRIKDFNATNPEHLHKLHVSLNILRLNQHQMSPMQTILAYQFDPKATIGLKNHTFESKAIILPRDTAKIEEKITSINQSKQKKLEENNRKIMKTFHQGMYVRFKKYGKKKNTPEEGVILEVSGQDILIRTANGQTCCRNVEDVYLTSPQNNQPRNFKRAHQRNFKGRILSRKLIL